VVKDKKIVVKVYRYMLDIMTADTLCSPLRAAAATTAVRAAEVHLAAPNASPNPIAMKG
jgi:hypothetical protein